MEKEVLKSGKRSLTGKKVRFLRRQGIIPANVYGHGIKSTAVECNEADLEKIIKGGISRIITLDVDGEKKKRNVFIKDISYHPIRDNLLHVDFYQVKMTEKMTVDVPLAIKGHAPALDNKENFLDQQLNELTIECLPDNLPSQIEVDINGLVEAGQSIHVGDLCSGEGITFITPEDYLVVRVAQAAKAGAEEEEAEEAGEEAGEPEKVGEEEAAEEE